jgi:hypothetical protein
MLSHYELYVKGKTFFKSPDFETLCKQTPMSRSSKTPHGFYLANRGIKAAPRRSVHPAGRGDAGFGAIKQHLPRLPPMSEKVVARARSEPPGDGDIRKRFDVDKRKPGLYRDGVDHPSRLVRGVLKSRVPANRR